MMSEFLNDTIIFTTIFHFLLLWKKAKVQLFSLSAMGYVDRWAANQPICYVNSKHYLWIRTQHWYITSHVDLIIWVIMHTNLTEKVLQSEHYGEFSFQKFWLTV